MTQYDKLAQMGLKEVLQWLDEAGDCGDAPWIRWFDETYCAQCKNEELPQCEQSATSCEFFNHYLSNDEILELWLLSEIKENKNDS